LSERPPGTVGQKERLDNWDVGDAGTPQLSDPDYRNVRGTGRQCSRIRILRFFQISKKHDFLRFFEMACQKNVKSR